MRKKKSPINRFRGESVRNQRLTEEKTKQTGVEILYSNVTVKNVLKMLTESFGQENFVLFFSFSRSRCCCCSMQKACNSLLLLFGCVEMRRLRVYVRQWTDLNKLNEVEINVANEAIKLYKVDCEKRRQNEAAAAAATTTTTTETVFKSKRRTVTSRRKDWFKFWNGLSCFGSFMHVKCVYLMWNVRTIFPI